MKIRYKLSLSVFLIGVFTISIVLFSFHYINTNIQTEHMLADNEENAEYISNSIENQLLDLIRLTTTIASSKTIEDSLIFSNNEFSSLTISDRSDAIDDLNTTWMNTTDINDPFIKSRMENDVASFLISQQEEYPELYGEVFLTNQYGVMISTTGKLTTLAHYDKYWWQGAFNDGEGIVYLDDRGYDASVEGYVLGVVVPIYDDENQIIGILKSNYNIEYIFENSIESFHELSLKGTYYVVRTLGLIVDGIDIEPLSESVSPNLLEYLDGEKSVSKEMHIEDTDKLVSITPINITFESDIIEFGGSYESVDHLDGNLGEGWSVIYLIDKNIALSSIRDILVILIIIGISLIVLVSISALIVGFRFSKPITNLNDYINEVAEGNLVKKEMKISNDEFGSLTSSFNNMIDNLEETLTSKKILEYERNRLQMYLDVAGVMIIVLNTKAEITHINMKGCKILESSEEEIIGKNWFDNFILNENLSDIKKVFENIMNNNESGIYRHENIIITSSGEKRIIRFNNSLLFDINNKVTGILSSGEDITDLKEKEIDLEYAAYNDFLTGLHNRRYYVQILDEIDIEENYPITIVMGDINGLKLINDAFGHTTGDKLLISASTVISENCRKNDILARIGGDEFVIIMPKTNEKEAEKIVKEIKKEAKLVMTESIPLSISFGYETKTLKNEDIQDTYRSAEDFMYREKLLEIPSMRSGAIETILNTLYEKDVKSELHSRSVSIYSERLAKAYGLSTQDVAEVKTAGLLHDIGKIIISSSIINKKGKLTPAEYEIIKTHPEIGFRILNSTSDMRGISNIVLNHHERCDGKGYPRGIKGEEIPIKSRIIAIADAFDAMTSERTYKDIISNEEALKEIMANAGTQFNIELAKVFEEHFVEITAK